MTYQIGNITITAEELAAMKRTELDCKFWIKRIQRARRNAIAMYSIPHEESQELVDFLDDGVAYDSGSFEMCLHDELAAIGVKRID